MKTLVVGPTSVGKSTFIDRHRHGTDDAVVLGFEIPTKGIPLGAEFIHYNLLHAWNSGDFSSEIGSRLRAEPILAEILRDGTVSQAIVLVAGPDELRQRIESRDSLEPLIRPNIDAGYDSNTWARVLDHLDLFRLYEELFYLLEEFGIAVRCVVSHGATNSPEFTDIDRLSVHRILRGWEPVEQPSSNEVDKALRLPGAHYQVVDLPGGVRSDAGGFNHVATGRRQTFESIFAKADLRNSSVLDVGCALGDFLFRAELRGALSLVGLEPHIDRYEAAAEFGRLRGSQARFENVDLYDATVKWSELDASETMFDWVLVLNVLHHVSDLHRFVSAAIARARQHIVFEFPTFNDPIWLADHSEIGRVTSADSEQLPLIGVGVRGYDQRFVFNDRAVSALVESVSAEFRPSVWFDSPISRRRIAVFCANGGCFHCCGTTDRVENQVQPDAESDLERHDESPPFAWWAGIRGWLLRLTGRS